MSDYVKSVNTESDEYEKKRKREAEEAVALINQSAAEKAAEAAATTDTQMAEERQKALQSADMAAVQRYATLSQAKEKLAAMGLSSSGLAGVAAKSAQAYQTRQMNTANKKRDAAVAALAEALLNTEAKIERERAAAVQNENEQVTDDVTSYRAGLLKSAYSAASKENVAKTEAAAKEAAAKTEAAAKEAVAKTEAEAAIEREKIKSATTEKELAQKQAKEQEKQRVQALEKLYETNTVPTEIYSQAIDKGWDVATTLNKAEEWLAYRRMRVEAQQRYQDEGFDSMMRYLAPLNLSSDQLDAICNTLNVPRKRVDEWLTGWRLFMESSPNNEWLEYYERKAVNEFTVL